MSSPGRGHPVFSPHREGTCGLCEQSKFRVRSFIGFLCKPRKIKPLSLPFTFNSFSLADAIILRVSLDPAGAGPRHPTPEGSDSSHSVSSLTLEGSRLHWPTRGRPVPGTLGASCSIWQLVSRLSLSADPSLLFRQPEPDSSALRGASR